MYYNISGHLTEGSDEANASTLDSIRITSNGAYTPENQGLTIGGWNYIEVQVTPNLQEKTETPTKKLKTITADYGFEGLKKVNINPIPEEYIIPSGRITIRDNGPVNVTNFSEALVTVEGGGRGSTTIVVDGSFLFIEDAEITSQSDDTITLRG
jgi:hypothetical protein